MLTPKPFNAEKADPEQLVDGPLGIDSLFSGCMTGSTPVTNVVNGTE